jgi:hypothetical protein
MSDYNDCFIYFLLNGCFLFYRTRKKRTSKTLPILAMKYFLMTKKLLCRMIFQRWTSLLEIIGSELNVW